MHGSWGPSWQLLSFVHPQVITSPSGKWPRSARKTSTETRKMFHMASTAAGTRQRRSTPPPSLPPWRTWAPSTGGRANTRLLRRLRTAPSDRGKRSASAQIKFEQIRSLALTKHKHTKLQILAIYFTRKCKLYNTKQHCIQTAFDISFFNGHPHSLITSTCFKFSFSGMNNFNFLLLIFE